MSVLQVMTNHHQSALGDRTFLSQDSRVVQVAFFAFVLVSPCGSTILTVRPPVPPLTERLESLPSRFNDSPAQPSHALVVALVGIVSFKLSGTRLGLRPVSTEYREEREQ